MPRPGYDSVVLLTGFPSFAARKMMEHVLTAEPRALVYAVVPSRLTAQARAEVEALEAGGRSGAPGRVVLLEGDPSAMDLGLSGAEIRQLAREVDRIHHLAHTGHAGVDRKVAEAVNVIGTAEILELARACSSLECLVHHSTALVAGDRRGVVYEDELEHGQGFRNAIEETRMRAEVLARRAMRELPIAIVRPTTIVGDSRTGEIDRLDGLYLLVLLIIAAPAEIAIPLPGRGEAPLNVVPIDFVVRAAHAIGRYRLAPGRTFHLADPRPLPARDLFDRVAHAGGRRAARGHIPSNLAKALLRAPGIERFVRSPRAFVEQLMTPVRYDTRNTDQALEGTGITCPPFESYVDALVAAVQDRMRERRERQAAEAEADVEDPLS
ncbi:MAG: SDR family oxidoreductase [Polyangiaceae bacterium]|nr:SDR family oxidoreductase [Polyangiaceae bacterium]